MGIVSKQASTATALSYIGVVIGFVNVTLLMTQLFSKEEFGLREILLNVAVFTSQIAHLGTYRSLVKFFPFFNEEKHDNGLLSIGLIVPFVGFLISLLLILLFKSSIVNFYIDKSPLFIEYFWFSIPLIFLLMYNNVFESYLQSRSNTAYSAFLKNVFNRLVITLLLICYFFKWIDFYWFIVLFVFSYAINIVLFVLYLIKRNEFSLKLNKLKFTKRVRKVYYNYSAFSILSGASSVLVNKVDALMIAGFLGLASTAIYANAVYLCILIIIPSDAIGKIAMPLLAKSWKEKRYDKIDELYKKSSLSQFLFGGAIFVLMWGSIDNFFALQGNGYSEGKMVFLILAISKLINMIFGVNGQIISVSKYYRFDTTTAILLGFLTILTNYIFIPIWHVEGAAFATALTIVVFNLIRFLFVLVKLKLQPFTIQTFYVVLILGITMLINEFLPHVGNIYLDTIYRSLIIALLIFTPTYFLKVSEDFNLIVNQYTSKLRAKK
ncbi:MAG: hypothetical protein DWP98_04690 [Bacteroidetes bacterium]|nr:MAG: hypothetical protein DWP98_04690 [Bacteroidota bacterium]MBL1144644.1 hypothetical protein [Bacteroidota bacterium]NOG57439.1 oligosaccharide flippase family protein [Bacteroidota bacterium]